MKILIVDDDPGFLNALKVGLVSNGYRVITAGDGHEALKTIRSSVQGEKHTEMMVTDLKMPGLNGLELIESARELDPGLRCILITAYGDATVQGKVENLECCGYLEKPFAPESFLQVIENLRLKD